MIPALATASSDDKLRGAPLHLYVWLVFNRLDLVEYRTLKVTGLSHALRIKRHTVSRSLRVLVDNGYLDRKAIHQDGFHYRLRLTRAA